jgi:hypothetical protein
MYEDIQGLLPMTSTWRYVCRKASLRLQPSNSLIGLKQHYFMLDGLAGVWFTDVSHKSVGYH